MTTWKYLVIQKDRKNKEHTERAENWEVLELSSAMNAIKLNSIGPNSSI
jgi:hypothetical protein